MLAIIGSNEIKTDNEALAAIIGGGKTLSPRLHSTRCLFSSYLEVVGKISIQIDQ
jgi:hypothetical protein